MKEYKCILYINRKPIFLLMLVMILSAAASVTSGYSLSWILNVYEVEEDRLRALLCSLLASVTVYTLAIVVSHIGEVFQFKVQCKVKNDLREIVSKKIANLSYNEFLQRDSGAYVSWLSNDVDQLYNSCFQSLFSCVEYSFMAIFALIVMLLNSWYLGLVAVILFILQFTIPRLLNKYLEAATKKRSAALEISLEAYKDTIMGAGILYLSNLRESIVKRILNASECVEKEIFICNRTNRRVKTVLSMVSLNNQIILISIGMLSAILGDAPLGMTLAIANLCGQFFNGVTYSVQAIMNVKSTKQLWNKFEFKEKVDKEKAVLMPVQNIKMKNITFSYGDRDILKGNCFDFRANEKYAIVGESGSGKSTVLKLIMGLLPAYEGKIFYDSTDQKKTNPDSFYKQVAYIDQQVYLFQDTLRFNITLGQNYSDEEIMEVIRVCKLDTWVNTLPKGLDTTIMENGKNLSGGQRQRIALARGIIRGVQYVFIDEGTSALDEENARDIEASLMESKMGIIMVSHNLREPIKSKLTKVYEL